MTRAHRLLIATSVWLRDNANIIVAVLWSALLLKLLQAVSALTRGFQRLEENLSSRGRTVQFSSVTQTKALDLMRAVQLTLVEGDLEELRAARPARRTAAGALTFAWSTSEAAGTPAALEFIRTQLQQLGVRFGRGGFTMLDMHACGIPLELRVGGMRFKGGIDGAIVPFSVATLSAANHTRVAIELKARSHEDADLGDRAVGQCIAELLSVNAQTTCPSVLLLTDGTTADVLRIQGVVVTRWAGMPLAEALAYVAQFLKTETSSSIVVQPGEVHVDPATAHTLRRLQELVPVPGAALAAAAEQLDALLAAEDDADVGPEEAAARREALATELGAQWRHVLEPHELPRHVQHMFV